VRHPVAGLLRIHSEGCDDELQCIFYHGCLRDADGNMGDAIGDDARILRRAGHAVDAEPDRGGLNLYSITSSAPLTSEGENSSPRLFAAFRLMMSSTFVTSWTGRSEGLSPLRTRPA
jgi:hypothetical protein